MAGCRTDRLPATLLAACALSAQHAHAEVTLDGTLGPATNLAGADYQIGADLGRQVGGNLFHSFARFNLANDESATFSGPATVANIISRVTGGAPSTIAGTLRSTIRDANLFFLNPAGVMFDEGAELQITGSFHVSTADYLQLGDAGRFHASRPPDSVLVAAAPSAFGFLGGQPAPITVQGATLEVPDAATLSVVGGDVRITPGPTAASSLQARSGRINVVSMAGAGEAAFSNGGIEVHAAAPGGRIEIVGNGSPARGTLGVPESFLGGGGGTILIRAGGFVLAGSSIRSRTDVDDSGLIDIDIGGDVVLRDSALIDARSNGAGRGADIRIAATGDVAVNDTSRISTSTEFSTGAAGDITVMGANVRLTTDADLPDGDSVGAQVISTTNAAGPAGNLAIHAHGEVVIEGQAGTRLASDSNAFAAGNAGQVAIDAARLAMRGGVVSAQAAAFGSGNAGEILIEVDEMALSDGALVTNSTAGTGNSGRIMVDAEQSVRLTGFPTSLQSSTTGTGDAGTVEIETDVLSLDDRALIETTTSGAGDAGNISIETQLLHLRDGAGLNNDVQFLASGNGGDISVTATEAFEITDTTGNLFLRTGITSATLSSGNAGSITIDTPRLASDNGIIEAQTLGTGNAGRILVEADNIEFTRGGRINSESGGSGTGGDVIVDGDGTFLIQGLSSSLPNVASGVSVSTSGSGDAGTMMLAVGELIVDDAGFINASTLGGSGNAGDLTIVSAGAVTLTDGGQISASTLGSGSAGRLTVSADGLLLIEGEGFAGDSRISARTGPMATGTGGDIVLSAGDMRLQAGGAVDAQSRGSGMAGNVRIDADRTVTATGGGRISTRAPASDGGDVTIAAGDFVYFSDSGMTTQVGSGAGGGGNIRVHATHIVADGSQIIADAFGGPGGNIRLASAFFFRSPDSAVTASSARNIDGIILIDAPDVDISGSLVALTPRYAEAAALLRDPCARRTTDASSRFVVEGIGGWPATPAIFLTSPVPDQTHAIQGSVPRVGVVETSPRP